MWFSHTENRCFREHHTTVGGRESRLVLYKKRLQGGAISADTTPKSPTGTIQLSVVLARAKAASDAHPPMVKL